MPLVLRDRSIKCKPSPNPRQISDAWSKGASEGHQWCQVKIISARAIRPFRMPGKDFTRTKVHDLPAELLSTAKCSGERVAEVNGADVCQV